jgi:2-polyprenyl-3-methyl-5-hydroxy-6-metoxy-1,4-benzoquinol methylase
MDENTKRKFADYAQNVSAKFHQSPETWLPRRFSVWRRAYKNLLPHIRATKSILDYGCGAGEFLAFLAQHTSAELYGYDPSATQLASAKQNCKHVSQIHLAEEIPTTQYFDMVFCNHVIEHVPDSDLAHFVSLLTGLVSPKGKLIITTPNGLNPFSYACFMASDLTHLRMHSPYTIAELLAPVGFQLDGVYRELPQIYDFPSLLKTSVYFMMAPLLRVAIMSNLAGIRNLKYPLITAPTFYVVASCHSRS